MAFIFTEKAQENRLEIAVNDYPTVRRIDPSVDSRGCDIVGDYVLRDQVDYMPQAGLQEKFLACDSNLIFLCGESQMGKAQPYTAQIATPNGFVTMGELKVGDEICGVDGGVQRVVNVYERGERDVYKLYFHDGSSTECCDEHLWKFANRKRESRVIAKWNICDFKTIKSLFDKGEHIYMPLSKPVYLNERHSDIDFYKFGIEIARKHKCTKIVPNELLFASIENRKQFLNGFFKQRGLQIDPYSDWCWCKVKSKYIAHKVQYLCRSVGLACDAISIPDDNWIYLYIGLYSNTSWIDGLPNTKSTPKRKLFRYEYLGKKRCRCIKVSNPDSLYLTDDFIVTHNTYGMFLKALCGLGKEGYTCRFISVRLQDSKKGGSIFRDAVQVCGNFGNCQYNASDYPTFVWPQWNNSMQLIHSNFNVDNPAEYEEFKDYAKKNQASLIMIDEATEMRSFKMFKYWFSRNRDSSGMIPQMVLSFNYVYGHFTNNMLKQAGYFTDDWYFRPEMNGKTRYFYVMGDNEDSIIWGDSYEEVNAIAHIDEMITEKERKAGITYKQIIKSFTAFSGESADNLKLLSATRGQNIGNLHNVGGKEREILKKGYAGPVDNEEINITRKMIDSLWDNPINDDENMYATMDISSGKDENDKCPMLIWKGLQVIALELFRGNPKEIAPWIQTKLAQYNVPITNFAYDATGHGYWMQGLTNGVPITANKRPIQEIDEYGNPVTRDDFFNCRSQLMGKLEVLIKSGYISIAIDKRQEFPIGAKGTNRQLIEALYDQSNVFITTTRNKKIYYRNKEEYRSKFKSSPDLIDAMSLRMAFELDARPKKQPLPETDDYAYDALYSIW